MRDRSFAGKTTRRTLDAAPRLSSASSKAAALTPPDYGIDFIDRGRPGAAPIQRHPELEEEMLQAKFDAAAARSPLGRAGKHRPPEAWHVVQQRRGQPKPALHGPHRNRGRDAVTALSKPPLPSPCGACEKKENLQTGPLPDEEEMLQSWVVGGKADEAGGATHDAIDGPLGAWVVGGAAGVGTNTIKCDGAGGIVVQADGAGSPAQSACLRDCIIQHEESHKADALAANAKICDGAAAGNIVTVDTAAERKATEVKASNVEIGCLRAKPDSDACRATIAARIAQMITYRDSF